MIAAGHASADMALEDVLSLHCSHASDGRGWRQQLRPSGFLITSLICETTAPCSATSFSSAASSFSLTAPSECASSAFDSSVVTCGKIDGQEMPAWELWQCSVPIFSQVRSLRGVGSSSGSLARAASSSSLTVSSECASSAFDSSAVTCGGLVSQKSVEAKPCCCRHAMGRDQCCRCVSPGRSCTAWKHGCHYS